MEFLVKELTDLIYDTQLFNEKVYSKQYFFSIIYSMYQTIPDDKYFCFTYGDFNGLGRINEINGKEAGDLAVEESIKVIKETMPKGTLICRIAGDEFAFLNPGYTKRDIKPFLEKVRLNLQNANQEKTKGLSIALASIDNFAYSNFDDMCTHSEVDVTKQKRKLKEQNFTDFETALQEKCNASFLRFFDYYRFDGTTLPEGFFENVQKSLSNIILSDIHKKESELQRYQTNLDTSLIIKTMPNTYKKYDQTTATTIHNILSTPPYKYKNLLYSNIDENDFKSLFKHLIKHPLTEQFEKKYFERSLGPSIVNGPKKKLRVRHFDILHMKLSNDLIGHDNTDKKMYELLHHIIAPISNKNKDAIFITRGGTLLLIEDENNATSDKEILHYVHEAQKNQLLLDLAYESTTCNSKSLFKTIEKLEEQCSNQKRKIKAKKMVEPSTMSLALQTALKDPINYYLENCDKPHSKSSLKKFVDILCSSLGNVVSKKFPEQISHAYSGLAENVLEQTPYPVNKSQDDD